MLKILFAALVATSMIGASMTVADAAPRKRHHHAKQHHGKKMNKDSSSYAASYRTQRSYYTCGYSRC